METRNSKAKAYFHSLIPAPRYQETPLGRVNPLYGLDWRVVGRDLLRCVRIALEV
jgi:hypothetical protein